MRNGNRRTPEFRREAVRLSLTRGRTQREIAEDLGIGLSTLTRWLSNPLWQLCEAGNSKDGLSAVPEAADSGGHAAVQAFQDAAAMGGAKEQIKHGTLVALGCPIHRPVGIVLLLQSSSSARQKIIRIIDSSAFRLDFEAIQRCLVTHSRPECLATPRAWRGFFERH